MSDNKMPEDIKKPEADEKPAPKEVHTDPVIDREAITADVREKEMKRIKGIEGIAKMYPHVKAEAREAIQHGTGLNDSASS